MMKIDFLGGKDKTGKGKKGKFVLCWPRSPLGVFLAILCAGSTFFCGYSIVGFWTATENINFPWSGLEPRNDPLIQVFWIGGSVFGFLVLFLVLPLARRNIRGSKQWLRAFSALGVYTIIATPLIFFVMIWLIGGVDGMLEPTSYSPSIVIALLAFLFIISLILACFLYLTEVIEENSSELWKV